MSPVYYKLLYHKSEGYDPFSSPSYIPMSRLQSLTAFVASVGVWTAKENGVDAERLMNRTVVGRKARVAYTRLSHDL
jgi:hydrogenase/urease accessory protein HupE